MTMRAAVLSSAVLAGAALLWATAAGRATNSWLLMFWVPWAIVTVYAWRNYRPARTHRDRREL